jgi:hypothetical protein
LNLQTALQSERQTRWESHSHSRYTATLRPQGGRDHVAPPLPKQLYCLDVVAMVGMPASQQHDRHIPALEGQSQFENRADVDPGSSMGHGIRQMRPGHSPHSVRGGSGIDRHTAHGRWIIDLDKRSRVPSARGRLKHPQRLAVSADLSHMLCQSAAMCGDGSRLRIFRHL